jgi:hypothetical protein
MRFLFYRFKLWLFEDYYAQQAEKQMWRDAYEFFYTPKDRVLRK